MKFAIALQSEVDEKRHLAWQMRPEHFADEGSGCAGRGALMQSLDTSGFCF